MRHQKRRLQLNRATSWYKATVASLARNILIAQSMKTTLDRAKASRRIIERLISLAKKNSLSARRKAFEVLGDHALVKVLFTEIGPRFANRSSGFTRIINLGKRRGDNAEMVIFELTERKIKEPKKPKKQKAEKPEAISPAGPEKETPLEGKKTDSQVAFKEKPTITKKPTKKFLGGIKNIFKKERDSL